MGLALLVSVWFTLPHCQAPYGCDSLIVRCAADTCDTIRVCMPETRLEAVRLYWQPRWAPHSVLLRTKGERGREGLRDSLEVPADTIATVWVAAVDQAGNEACLSNPVTVNLPPVSVPPLDRPARRYWLDVAGRRYSEFPTAKGVYWEIAAGRHGVRRLVLVK